MATALKKLKKLPGDDLFQYIKGEKIVDVTSGSLNKYIESITFGSFTAKDFRTWRATSEAVKILLKKKRPETESELDLIKKEVFESVSSILGNTPATTKNSYVYPGVFEHFMDGTLLEYREAGRAMNKSELTISEKTTIAMLSIYSN